MRICVFRSSAVVIYVVGTGQSSNCNRRKRSSLTFLQIKWHNTWIICETKNCFFLPCIFHFDACERKSERVSEWVNEWANDYVFNISTCICSDCILDIQQMHIADFNYLLWEMKTNNIHLCWKQLYKKIIADHSMSTVAWFSPISLLTFILYMQLLQRLSLKMPQTNRVSWMNRII